MTNFEDKVRASMANAAPPRATTDDDRALLQAKLAVRGHSGLRVWRWRMPLLAAAAVVAVAVTTVAIVASGSGGGSHVATPGTGDADTSGADNTTVEGLVFAHHPYQDGGMDALLQGVVIDVDGCLAVTADHGASVTVPSFSIPGADPAALRTGDRVALSGGFVDADTTGGAFVVPEQCRHAVEATDGYFIAWQLTVLDVGDGTGTDGVSPGAAQGSPASVAPTTATPPVQAEPVTVPVDTVFAGTADQSFDLQLLAGGGLQMTGAGTDADSALGHSDGTPLGYVYLAPSRSELAAPEALDSGSAYLYGLVGPEVDRIAVLVTDSRQEQAKAGGDYTGAELRWVVADQGDPVGTDGRGARILWTSMGDGWRAFAVQTAAPSPMMTVLAWDSDRELLQARQFSPNGDTVTDLPTAHAPDLDVWDPLDPAPRFGPNGPNGADGPFVATYPDLPDGNFNDALLEGTVAVQGGCVVATSGTGDAYTLIFPQSQVEPAEPPAAVRFNGTDYHDGDPIAVGGAVTTFTANGTSTDCPTQAWSVTPQ